MSDENRPVPVQSDTDGWARIETMRELNAAAGYPQYRWWPRDVTRPCRHVVHAASSGGDRMGLVSILEDAAGEMCEWAVCPDPAPRR